MPDSFRHPPGSKTRNLLVRGTVRSSEIVFPEHNFGFPGESQSSNAGTRPT
jgi:hypothetical protein